MAKALTIGELKRVLPRFEATVRELAAMRAKSAKQLIVGASPEVLVRILRAVPSGLSLGELSKKSGVDVVRLKYQLRKLRAQKKVRVIGNTRSACWFAR